MRSSDEAFRPRVRSEKPSARSALLNDAKFYDFSESFLRVKDNITQKLDGARTPPHNFLLFAQGVRGGRRKNGVGERDDPGF